MKRIKNCIWYLVLQLVLINAFTSEDEQKIDEFITGLMSCSGIPAASFSLVQNEQKLMAKGYGVANLETNEQCTADTKFSVGSCSKAFNSALLASTLSRNKKYVLVCND